MPVLTDKPSDTDSRNDELNPSQQDYDRRFNDIAAAEKSGDKGLGERNNSGNPVDALQRKEAESNLAPAWKNNVTTGASKKLAKGILKGKGALIGAGGSIGVIGVILSMMGYAGLASLPMSLTNNAVSKNDARGSILERRLANKISYKMRKSSTICDTKLAACRAGKIPKSMLSAMADNGIEAYKGNTAIKADGNGYIENDKIPDNYRYTDSKGKLVTVNADNFAKNYKSNPEFRKMFKGAYNMRYRGYTGKYIEKNFFKKFGIKKKGGLAGEADLTDKNASEKLDSRLKTNPDTTSEDGVKRTFKERMQNLRDRSVNKIKRSKGDLLLLVGATGCTAVDMPKFIANSYRAIQLAQILVLVSDIVLSPGGMQQAGDIDGEKIAAIGNLLTEKTKNADGSTGKAAVDSAILQSAIGVNTNKVSVTKYTPGYSLLTNSFIQKMSALSGETKKTCNVINSPQAAMVVNGVEAAIATTAPGIGTAAMAALKAVGSIVASNLAIDAAVKVVDESGLSDAIANVAYGAAKNVIGNYVDGVRGEELGDVLGTAMFAYFSQAGSAGGAAPLTTDQVKGFSNIMASVDNEYREEDIATLSPFDTSSQYTFLGSIVSNMSLHSSQTNPVLSGISMMGYILKAPFTTLASTSTTNAVTAETDCGHAGTFGIEKEVAINVAGYPCVGIPEEYINMSEEEIMSYVQDDIDPETGEVKDDSDTGDVVAECNSGDLESVSGCTVSGDDAKKRAAQSLYQYDLQIENILNGEDEGTE